MAPGNLRNLPLSLKQPNLTFLRLSSSLGIWAFVLLKLLVRGPKRPADLIQANMLPSDVLPLTKLNQIVSFT